jgi:hypothetical protein
MLPADGRSAVFVNDSGERRVPLIGWGVRQHAPPVVGLIAEDRVIALRRARRICSVTSGSTTHAGN